MVVLQRELEFPKDRLGMTCQIISYTSVIIVLIYALHTPTHLNMW